jgi:hypothetical protein
MIDGPDELRLDQVRRVNSGSAHRERNQIHVHCSIRGCFLQPDLFVSDKYLLLVDLDVLHNQMVAGFVKFVCVLSRFVGRLQTLVKL